MAKGTQSQYVKSCLELNPCVGLLRRLLAVAAEVRSQPLLALAALALTFEYAWAVFPGAVLKNEEKEFHLRGIDQLPHVQRNAQPPDLHKTAGGPLHYFLQGQA